MDHLNINEIIKRNSKFVLRQLLIFQYNGYNTEFFKKFLLQYIIWRKTDGVCAFCKENVETIPQVFMNCSDIIPLLINHSMHIYRKNWL